MPIVSSAAEKIMNPGITQKPLVSVIVNNYNYARFLGEAIDSALAQTYENTEVIVVDDGSIDDSRTVIESYGNRVKAIYKRNGGQASAMNAGFAMARGELIYFLDADDRAAPDCLERVVNRYRTAPDDLAIVQFKLQTIDGDGKSLHYRMPEIERMQGGEARRMLREKGSYVYPPTSGNIFTRKILKRIMPIPEPDFRVGADIYLCTLAALLGSIEVFEDALGEYRVHGANNFASADALEDVSIERFVEMMTKEARVRLISKKLCAVHLRRPIGGNTDLLHLIFDSTARKLSAGKTNRFRLMKQFLYEFRADRSRVPLRNKIGAFVYLTTIAMLPVAATRSLVKIAFVRPPKYLGTMLKKSFGQ